MARNELEKLRRALPRPYCLRCYARLPDFAGASQHCDACGHINVKADQTRFWTQEPRLRAVEWAAKALISIAIGWITSKILFTPGGVGMGQGWAIGLPVLGAVVLWDTASKITRQGPYFRAGLLWSVIGWLLGPLLLWAGLVNAFNRNGVSLTPWLIGIGALLTACAALGPTMGRRYVRWLMQRIRRRSELRRADLAPTE